MKNKIKNFVWLIVLVALIGALLGIPDSITHFMINIIIGFMIGSITSAIAGQFIESLSGDFLKKILITFEIKGIRFSFTIFAIVTIIVEFWLFR